MKKIFLLMMLSAIFSSSVNAELFDRADVISATPRFRTYTVPRNECWTEAAPQGDRSVTGAILGGIAGGLLGNQMGKGNGKTAATATGAVAGAITGDHVQNGSGQSATGVRHCHTVQDEHQQPDGYDVTYTYGGRNYTDHLSYNPGPTVKVKLVIQ